MRVLAIALAALAAGISIGCQAREDASSAPGRSTGQRTMPRRTIPPPQPSGPLERTGDTLALAQAPGVAPIRFPDVAYDSRNDVYLVVTGNNMTGGTFISAAGAPIGSSFQINTSTFWTQVQRVAYCADIDAFLVTWHDTRNYGGQHSEVWGRFVTYRGGQPAFPGSDFRISTATTHAEHPGTTAWNPAAREFLTAWQGVDGGSWDIHARRVGPTGALLGSEIAVSSTPYWDTDPDVVYHPGRGEFAIAYATETAQGVAAVHLQRVSAAGSLVGAPSVVATAGGTWIPDLELVPATGQYMVSWWQGGAFVRVLNGDGSPAGVPFQIAQGYGSYDALCVAFNPVSGTFGAVVCGHADDEVYATEVSPAGGHTTPFMATRTSPVQPNYYPRLAASTARAEWLVVASRGYASPVVQRLRKP